MPLHTAALRMDDVRRFAESCFTRGAGDTIGVEVESLVGCPADPLARPGPERMPPGPLPRGSRVTVEPGGQIELSTPPRDLVDDALDDVEVDEQALAACLARTGMTLLPGAVDGQRAPRRVLDLPRYRAMEAFFDAGGPDGRQMMCNTASVQVNVANSTEPAQRWRLAHLLAPVLVAAFGASPGRDREGASWASLRQRAWSGIDPGRTALPSLTADPVAAWTRYLLDADVMLIRSGEGVVGLRPGFSFARWLAEGHDLGRPTQDDLRYHASTLFPPVRPKGWLEIRVLDALPPAVREVAVLVVAAALRPGPADELRDRLPEPAGLLLPAARHGLGHPVLAAAADLLLDVAVAEVDRVTSRPERVDAVHRYRETHVRRRRQPSWCPGDVR